MKNQATSSRSPTSICSLSASPAASSKTLQVLKLILVIRKGCIRCHIFVTVWDLFNATTSIANRIPMVWTPDEGLISIPHPATSRFRPASPSKRLRCVLANTMLSAIRVPRVLFIRIIILVEKQEQPVPKQRSFCDAQQLQEQALLEDLL